MPVEVGHAAVSFNRGFFPPLDPEGGSARHEQQNHGLHRCPTVLFQDADEEVRDAAAGCFRNFERAELADYGDLAKVYLRSPAFTPEKDSLAEALDRSIANLPHQVLEVAKRFLDEAGKEAADIRTRRAAFADVIGRLVVRVYGRSSDPRIRSRCLDLIDNMTAIRAYGLEKAITQLER